MSEEGTGAHGAVNLHELDVCCGEVELNCAACHHVGMKVVSADGATTTIRCPECDHEATIAKTAPVKPGTEV